MRIDGYACFSVFTGKWRTEPGLLFRLFFLFIKYCKSGGEVKANYNIENSSYAKKKGNLLRNVIRLAVILVFLSAIAFSTYL